MRWKPGASSRRLHGAKRSWYPRGVPEAEYRCGHGFLTAARAWTEAGTGLSAAATRVFAAADERFYASPVAIVRANLRSRDERPGPARS